MLEKALNAWKNNILLRLIMACMLLLPLLLPVGVSAYEVYPYTDFVSSSGIDTDGNYVYLTFDPSAAYLTVASPEAGTHYQGVGGSASWYAYSSYTYFIDMYPLGLTDGLNNQMTVDNSIPNGSTFSISWKVNCSVGHDTPSQNVYLRYYDDDYNLLRNDVLTVGVAPVADTYTLDFLFDRPEGATRISFYVQIAGLSPLVDNNVTVSLLSCNMKISIDSLFLLQQQTGETNRILTEVGKQLEKNGQTLEDILQKQEELPGQIGDEMQGIIDNEKNEASTEGNKFVDQILSALPDPSQDVLAALKSLPDAMAYTGTDATLQIPALVMPAVGDLIPQTELWEGGELPFDEYIGMLPPTLMILVQSLFTIAIVLYCVYEFKGLISYCLTLRESKGG